MYNYLNLFFGNKSYNQRFLVNFFLKVLGGVGRGSRGEEGWSRRTLGSGDSVGDEMEAGWGCVGCYFFEIVHQ